MKLTRSLMDFEYVGVKTCEFMAETSLDQSVLRDSRFGVLSGWWQKRSFCFRRG